MLFRSVQAKIDVHNEEKNKIIRKENTKIEIGIDQSIQTEINESNNLSKDMQVEITEYKIEETKAKPNDQLFIGNSSSGKTKIDLRIGSDKSKIIQAINEAKMSIFNHIDIKSTTSNNEKDPNDLFKSAPQEQKNSSPLRLANKTELVEIKVSPVHSTKSRSRSKANTSSIARSKRSKKNSKISKKSFDHNASRPSLRNGNNSK